MNHPPSDQSQPRTIELIARAVCVADGHVLLCRNRKHGYCFLPGGHVEPGEQASAALARELMEEARLIATVGGMGMVGEVIFTARNGPHHEVNLVFYVERLRLASDPGWLPPDPVESLEKKIGFEWVQTTRLPELDLRPALIRAWLMSDLPAAAPDRPDWFSVRQ